MKKNLSRLVVISGMLITISSTVNAQNTFPATGAAGIGTTTPDASSVLDITSTTKGLLAPRMTQTQRNAIVSPAAGLLIYQTSNTKGFYYYNGTAWTAISTKGANTTLSNLVAPTAVNQSLLPGTNGTSDLGSSTNAWKDIYASGKVGVGTTAPVTPLHVTTNTTAVLATFEGVTGSNKASINLKYGGISTYLTNGGFNMPAGNLGFGGQYHNSPDLMINTNTGNVGIGTTTPVTKLDINGTMNCSDTLYLSGGAGFTPTGFLKADGTNIRVQGYSNVILGNTNSNSAILTVNYNGLVGINTTGLPDAKLHVNGNIKIADGTQGAGKVLTSDANGLATWQTPSGGGSGWGLTGNAGTAASNFIGTTDNRSLRFSTNNTQKMIIDSLGKVGIGTTTPADKLTVQTATSSYGIMHTDGTITVGSFVGGTTGGGQFGTKSNHNLSFFTNNSLSQMTLTTSGNVGIGTSNPAEKLEVTGSLRINGVSGNHIIYNSPNGVINWGPSGNLFFRSLSTQGNPTTYTDRMVITSSGQVAIGASNPATGYKLTVAGSIICTELKVQVQPFPDYVFASDYNLKSIDEVEQHIKAFKRLPGMPGACEVEEAGMSVGEMTGKVVEKVEENTLYIIQLNKENKELKEQLKSIQVQLDALKK